jgi:hypothetical protein
MVRFSGADSRRIEKKHTPALDFARTRIDLDCVHGVVFLTAAADQDSHAYGKKNQAPDIFLFTFQVFRSVDWKSHFTELEQRRHACSRILPLLSRLARTAQTPTPPPRRSAALDRLRLRTGGDPPGYRRS